MQSILSVFKSTSPQRLILFYYALCLFIATLLMQIPLLYRSGASVSFMDTVFVAASGISVTGLTTVNIAETFSVPGYIVLMFILNLGGIGIMAVSTFVWVVLGVKVGLKERAAIMVDNSQVKMSGGVKLVLNIVQLLFVIELIGAIIYTTIFYIETGNFAKSLLDGVFLSISATTNCGFDLYEQSLIGYSNNYFIQVPVMIQIVLGAIGYPVLIEIKEYFSKKNKRFKFSLFTKVTVTMYSILFVLGAFMYTLLEWNGNSAGESAFSKIMNGVFMSISARSGGIVVEDPATLNEVTQMILSMLMFIGSSPSSAAGGIRTTTLLIIIVTVYSFSKGRKHVSMFKRTIARQDIDRAFVVLAIAMFLVFIGICIIAFVDGSKLGLGAIIFEVTSAFGTCGMSMGITKDLSTVSECVIILFMFIGRVGFVSFLLSIGGKQTKEVFKYPEERLMVG